MSNRKELIKKNKWYIMIINSDDNNNIMVINSYVKNVLLNI